MKKYLYPLLVLLLLTVATVPVPAQEEENVEVEDNTDLDSLEAALNAAARAAEPSLLVPVISPADWEDWWQRSLQYQRQDSLDRALACADSVAAITRRSDLYLPALASYWLYRSGRALQARDRALAKRYSSLALAVNSASVPAILADFPANTGVKGFRRALGELVDQLAGASRDFGAQLRYGSQLLVWVCLGLLFWGLIYALYLSVKYLPRLAHAVAEFSPKFLSGFSRTFLVGGLVLGLAVAAAWLSLPAAILLLAVFCAALATTRETVFLFISAALILAAAVGLSLGHHLFSRIDDEYLETVNRASHAPFSGALYDKLAGYQARDSSDLLPPFAMALLDKRAGRHDRAQAILYAMSNSAPNAPAINNLGNLFFLRKSYDTAAACYRQAIEWDRSLALAHYNLAQVHLARLDFNSARDEQERAVRLDLAGIEARAARTGSGVPLDHLVSGRLLWARVLDGWNPLTGFNPRETITLSGLPLWLSPPAASALLIALILWVALMRGRLRQEDCVTCGAMICRKCHTATLAGEKLCRSCTDKIGLATAPELQQQLAGKLAARKHFRQMLQSGLANLVLPGSVLVIDGSVVGAWLLALGWSAVAVALIANGAGLPAGQLITGLAGNGALWWIAGVGGLLLVVSWLGYLGHIGRRGEPEAPLPRTKPNAGEPRPEGVPEGGDHAA